MYWLYILICLSVKYILYSLTEKFHFSFIHTLELVAININLNKITNFYLPKTVSDIFTFTFFGVPLNQSEYLELIYSILGSSPLLILFIIKDIISYLVYKKTTNIKAICLKFCLISFLPFLTLAIRDISYLETNSFINSFIAIFVISFLVIGLPAYIFDILYGKSRLRTRKKYYFLLDNFTKNYKFMSIIYLLQKIIDSIGLALYSFNPIIFNTFLLIWKALFLFLNFTIFKNSYEDFINILINSFLQISILLLNYGFIFTNSITVKIVLNVIYCLELFIYIILCCKRTKKIKDVELEDDIELANNDRITPGIPDWAIREYMESFEEDDNNIL